MEEEGASIGRRRRSSRTEEPRTPPQMEVDDSRTTYKFSGPRPRLVSPTKASLNSRTSIEDRRAAFLSGGNGTSTPTRPALAKYTHLMSPPQHLSPGNRVPECSCKHSKCLKLYCECFSAGVACTSSCKCYGCCNDGEHDDYKIKAIKTILQRNPHAFSPKVMKGPRSAIDQHDGETLATTVETFNLKGCNCRRSGCLKRYCDCYQSGVQCTMRCKCSDCMNYAGAGGGAVHPYRAAKNASQTTIPTKKPASKSRVSAILSTIITPKKVYDLGKQLMGVGDDCDHPQEQERVILSGLKSQLEGVRDLVYATSTPVKKSRGKKKDMPEFESEAVRALSALKHFSPPATPTVGAQSAPAVGGRSRRKRTTKRRRLDEEYGSE